jgi:hypothetical protein
MSMGLGQHLGCVERLCRWTFEFVGGGPQPRRTRDRLHSCEFRESDFVRIIDSKLVLGVLILYTYKACRSFAPAASSLGSIRGLVHDDEAALPI